MKLNLFWEDTDKNTYKLGKLYKTNSLFNFDINEDELKKAIKRGCFGIGEFNFLKNHYESTELFDFFNNRIPKKADPFIDNILSSLNLNEYNEIELLRLTEGKLPIDRYFLKEDL